MPRSVAELPVGTRITDHISLGVIAKAFPPDVVERVLAETGRRSKRQRDLPAHVMVYYVIALALYLNVSSGEVLRCLLEGIRWLAGPDGRIRVAGRSGISQARARLGVEPVRRLHDEVVVPIATPATRGAFFRAWRLVSLDGSSLDIADTAGNEAAFGRPGASRGHSAYPKIRFVSLVENGTHVLFATEAGPCKTSEMALAAEVVQALRAGMLCLADRGFCSFALWSKAAQGGADLLFRIRKDLSLPCLERLGDGSYLSRLRPGEAQRKQGAADIPVRVVEYALDGIEGSELSYRLLTTILDPEKASAEELAALYAERWEIETALDELKTHLRGPGIVLRSRTPELVVQEFYGLMMAHFAVRGLMHEAALKKDIDPDRISYTHAVRVIRRKLPLYVLTPP
ncbi:MAG: IS4 family transposase [Actinomycetota bacterium]|nr:IS4 family transposase [Actinomycetota bacterium]